MSSISNAFTKRFNVRYPIISAPMYYGTTPHLVAEVIKAGGMGFMAGGPDSSVKLKEGLQTIRKETSTPSDAPITAGVGLLGFSLDRTEASDDPRVPAVLDEKIAAIWLAFGSTQHGFGAHVKIIRQHEAARDHKTAIFVMVNSVEQALIAANEWKVDALVVQGAEAGGHGGAAAPPLLQLITGVLAAVPNGPLIVAAGGVSTGAQAAALLTAGASAVVLGTRFLFTPESMYTPTMKEVLLQAGLNSTARSTVFDDMTRFATWPEGIDGRAVVNDIVKDLEAGLAVEERLRRFDESKAAGDRNRLVIWAGAGAGLVNEIKSAKDVVEELSSEMVAALRNASNLVASQ